MVFFETLLMLLFVAIVLLQVARRFAVPYPTMLAIAGDHPREVSEFDALRRDNIAAKRIKLAELRREGVIDDDVFHALEQELDWAELAVSSPVELEES